MSEKFQKMIAPIDNIDRIIHAPARMLIMAHLSIVESADFTYLLNQTGLTRGNLSTHLAKLEEANYVSISKEFVDKIPRTLIRISENGRKALNKYSENMLQVINGFLNV